MNFQKIEKVELYRKLCLILLYKIYMYGYSTWGNKLNRSNTYLTKQLSNFSMNSSVQDSNLNVQYLNLFDQPSFIIKISSKEYKCNPLGVNSSKIIKEYRDKNPNSNQYEYNIDNSNNEFQVICDIFNFKQVQLTTKNMNFLLHVCEDLQIECFLKKITSFSDLYESIIQESDNIDEIFSLLYQIQSLSIEKVKNSILDSIWIENIENIKEFVSIFLQVVQTSHYQDQPFLINFLISLDQSSNEIPQLKNLMPFFIKKIKALFFKCNLYCSFVYQMIKKGLITLDEIIDLICEIDPNFNDGTKKAENIDSPYEKFEQCHHKNIVIWFFPELYEKKDFLNR